MIIAHLGNGSNMCVVKKWLCITSRAIDPNVMLYMLSHSKMTMEEMTKLLYRGSGLLGLSCESNDIRDVLNSKSVYAKFVIDLFVYKAQL